MRTHFLRSALLVSCLLPSGFAASFSQLVVFGDSLSDSGNAAIVAGPQFPANYWNGRITDGPTTTPATNGPIGNWADQLSVKLGVADPQPFLAGGTNYAVATAQTGSNGLDGITDQVNAFSLKNLGAASSTALYTFWGGANDIFNNAGNPLTAADSLSQNIQTLAAEGGKTFLWVNLPPLGSTPLGTASGQSTLLNAAAAAFNTEWSADITKLQGQGINVIGVDVFSTFNQVAQAPGAFGFSNVTSGAQGVAGVDPNSYLFWDQEHPTTTGHQLIADAAYSALMPTGTPTPAPEPASILFTALGMAAMLVVVRVRALRHSAVHRSNT